jgi:hypothetical protein
MAPESWISLRKLAGNEMGASDDLARSIEARLDRSLCQSAEQQRAQVLSCEMDLSFGSLQMRQQLGNLSRPIVCVCTDRIRVFVPGLEYCRFKILAYCRKYLLHGFQCEHQPALIIHSRKSPRTLSGHEALQDAASATMCRSSVPHECYGQVGKRISRKPFIDPEPAAALKEDSRDRRASGFVDRVAFFRRKIWLKPNCRKPSKRKRDDEVIGGNRCGHRGVVVVNSNATGTMLDRVHHAAVANAVSKL